MYNKKLLTFTFCLIIVLALTAILPSCSEDCPTCPEPEIEQEKEYHMLYSRVGVDYWVYTYSTKTLEVVDSVRYGRFPFWDVKFSQDGKYAFYGNNDSGIEGERATWVTDYSTGDTLEIVYGLSGHWLTLSYDEKYLLASSTIELVVFTIPDLDVAFRLEGNTFSRGAFHASKNIVYVTQSHEDSLYIIDLEDEEVTISKTALKTKLNDRTAFGMGCSVSLDGTKLLMNVTDRMETYFQIRSIENLEIMYEYFPDFSYPIVHSDGKRVFLNRVVDYDNLGSSIASIWELNLETLLLKKIVDASDFSVYVPYLYSINPGDLQITPDGKFAFFLNSDGWSEGPIMKLDLDSYDIVDVLYPPRGVARVLRINPIEIK